MISLVIPGEPVPWCRPQFTRYGKTYTEPKSAAYKERIQIVARYEYKNAVVFEDPLRLDIVFYLPIPQSWSKIKQALAQEGVLRPAGRPDADNLGKAVLDGLNKIVYKDDAQVVELQIKKYYDENPRTEVFFTPMGYAPAPVEDIKPIQLRLKKEYIAQKAKKAHL